MALQEAVSAEQEARDQAQIHGSGNVAKTVVCLGNAYLDASPDQIASLLPWLRTTLGGASGDVLVGYPVTHGDASSEQHEGFLLQPFVESVATGDAVVQTAAAWLHAYELVRAHDAQCCLLLGGEAESLQTAAAAALVGAVCTRGVDLAVPRYDMPTNQGLLNAAVLAPVPRALFGTDIAFPLALDFACSARMAERMAAAAQRFTSAGQADAVVWPVSEAALAGYSLAEVPSGERIIPQVDADLVTILTRVAGSLFNDAEMKAAFWQRTRPATQIVRVQSGVRSQQGRFAEEAPRDEIDGLISSFRNGYNNLHEIWSLVLPPNTLVALKRLSASPADTFRVLDGTWVRIVYDFVLAHRLRTISRNHLMGAFAPLYLAWVASHLAQGEGEAHVEHLAKAFEADKPYLVSRWRWPDRFNP